MKRALPILCLVLAFFQANASKIFVSGQLTTNTIWQADTVLISGTLVINNGALLIIKPGVKVLGGAIEVQGSIQALGKADSTIFFGDEHLEGSGINLFSGIKITDVKNSNDSSIFTHCEFEKVSNREPLFLINNSKKVVVKNCGFNGQIVRSMLISSFNSNVKFIKNSVKHFKERAIEFAGGNDVFSNNVIDSCLNYRYGRELVYFGAGAALAEGNAFSVCGDSTYPSEIYSTVIFDNGSECVFKNNIMRNSWNLALRIEGGSAPQIIGTTIKNYFAGVLLSNTHQSKRVIFRDFVIDGTAEDGVYAGIDVRANFFDCSIKNCAKTGIYVMRDSEFSFARDSFINNGGSGIYIGFVTTSAQINECYFLKNSANYGGGVFIADRSTSTVNNCIFKNNLAVTGGGISAGSGSSIQNCTFTGNQAYSFGGGAFVQGCVFTNNSLTNNRAFFGGGLATQRSNYYRSTYENNYIAKNYADSLGGGAIVVIDRYITFRNNHIENNKAGYAGGGLSVYISSKSWMSGLLINNNESPFGAGLNFEENGTSELKLSNLSVVNNKSSKKYGALRNKSKDQIQFTNSVFWGNDSENGLDFYSEWDNLDPGFDHCLVQGGFSNFDLNGGVFNGTKLKITTESPNFNTSNAVGIDTVNSYSYYFPSSSDLYNGGKTDTTGLRIAKRDLNNTSRIGFGKIDLGAVEFLELPSFSVMPKSDSVCEASDFMPLIAGSVNNATSVKWYKDGVQIYNKQNYTINSFSAKDAGKYWVKAANAAGAVSTDTFILHLKEAPTVTLIGKDTTLCSNNNYTLKASGNFSSYKWQDGSTAKTFNPSTNGEYWVEAQQNSQGCFGRSDTVTISVTEPTFINDVKLGFEVADQEYRLNADLKKNDGYDSLLWKNKSELWQQISDTSYLVVTPANGDGEYVVTAYLNNCIGTPSSDFQIIFPSVGEKSLFNLELNQMEGLLSVYTNYNNNLSITLYTLGGQELLNADFTNSLSINVSDFRSQVLLISVTDKSNGANWVDKIFIK